MRQLSIYRQWSGIRIRGLGAGRFFRLALRWTQAAVHWPTGLLKRFARLGWMIACLTVLASGCTPKPDMGEAVDLHARMGPQPAELPAPRLQQSPGALGPEAPYLPLVRPPQVQRVWVTAHLNDDGDLIAGHWVYLMITPSQWLLRGYEGTRELRLKLPAPIAREPQER